MKRAVLTFFTILCLLSSILLSGSSFNVQPARAEPKTWTVDDDGPADFQTIQEAINAADPRDSVYVCKGTYYEHVVVNKSISLIGENKHNTIIDGNLSGTVVRVTASDVKITGFTTQKGGEYSPNCGIYVGKSNTGANISSNIIADNLDAFTLDHSSNNIISENNITNSGGICLTYSSNNVISKNNVRGESERCGVAVSQSSNNLILKNNITSCSSGISVADSSDNTISGNNIINNTGTGLVFYFECSGNVFFDNNVVDNQYGVDLSKVSNNFFYHNSFINNTHQIDSRNWGENIWDDDYPSGGNYWSDFEERYADAKDVYSGLYQNETGSDGIWDRFYSIDSYNRDNYPLVNSCTPTEHDLVVFSLTTPDLMTLGSSSSLNATVTNVGSSDETNVEFLFLTNGTIVDSTTILLLQAGDSHKLSYLWTPIAGGTYNITAYAHPVSGETSVENNQNIKFITVVQVGVKAGDWIKYAYTYAESPETPYTEWIKVEFLSVEGTTVTIRGTIHLSDGTEQNETFTVDIADHMSLSHAPVFDNLSGFVIPANSTVGYTAWIGMTDGKPCACINPHPHLFTCCGSGIEDETERTYVGTSRIVVYAKYSTYVIEHGPLTCYWDKQTGVLVEVCNTRSDGWTAQATETNIQAIPEFPSFLILPLFMIATLLAVILYRRKRSI